MNETPTNLNEIPTTYRHVVRRRDRGLSVAGTRITLYLLMDYIKEGYPTKFIKGFFNLTDEQMADVMDYIETHKTEFEAEYQLVLRKAEEIRQYWEERNRERFAQIAAKPPKPGQEEIRAKLQAWKTRLGIA
jgi:uncharacterized protein (DUF433 family)